MFGSNIVYAPDTGSFAYDTKYLLIGDRRSEGYDKAIGLYYLGCFLIFLYIMRTVGEQLAVVLYIVYHHHGAEIFHLAVGLEHDLHMGEIPCPDFLHCSAVGDLDISDGCGVLYYFLHILRSCSGNGSKDYPETIPCYNIGTGGIAFYILGLEPQLVALLAYIVDHKQGTEIEHCRAFLEGHKSCVGFTAADTDIHHLVCVYLLFCVLFFGGNRRSGTYTLEHSSIFPYGAHMSGKIRRRSVIILYYIYLGFEKVGCRENKVIESPCVLNDRLVLPYYIEHILHRMGKVGHIFKTHHSGGALDGVHYTEYLVYLVLTERAFALGFYQYLVELFKQRCGLEYIGIDH